MDIPRAHRVALLAEGVDRNKAEMEKRGLFRKSPSSRRAWIEIVYVLLSRCMNASPSSRRAWIEIKGDRTSN